MAGFGRLQVAGGAVQQAGADLVLQLQQAVAGGGGGQAQAASGGGYAAKFNRAYEYIELV